MEAFVYHNFWSDWHLGSGWNSLSNPWEMTSHLQSSHIWNYFETITEPVDDNTDNKAICTLNHLFRYALLHALWEIIFFSNRFEFFIHSSLFSFWRVYKSLTDILLQAAYWKIKLVNTSFWSNKCCFAQSMLNLMKTLSWLWCSLDLGINNQSILQQAFLELQSSPARLLILSS